MARRIPAALVALIAATVGAYSGGPLEICDPATGTPYTWQIPPGGPPAAFYNVEAGPLNSGIDNATAAAAVTSAFLAWEAVPTASITYTAGPPLVDLGVFDPAPGNACTGAGTPIDVDETNFFCVFGVNDGQSPVVFDNDGALFAFLGLPPGVLGFAFVEFVTVGAPCAVVEGFAALGGTAIMPDGPGTLLALDDTLVHEFGHFSNLAHTVVNGEARLFGDETGPTPTDFYGPVPDNFTATMYPFAGPDPEGAAASLAADDIAIISTLYPDAGFPAGFGVISGTVLASDGLTGLTGVNVIARNDADPFGDAVSAISGDFTQGGGPLGNSDGSYTLSGLTLGADYVVYIDEILDGGFSTPLLGNPLGPSTVYGPFPGPEETYNGPSESADGVTDDPAAFFTVAAAATTPGIDIIINGTSPAGFCGDSVVDPPETCDPPGLPTGLPDECRIDCTFCGDGVVNGLTGTELLVNGGFESGDFTGWTVTDLAGSAGTFITLAPGATLPTSGNTTAPNPAGGSFFAVTDQGGPGTHTLTQSFTVPAGATGVFLSFQMFVNDYSGSGGIVDPIGLDHTGPANQHGRVDILSAGSGPFDTGPGVLANYYLGVDAGTNPNPYTSYNIDISAAAVPGGTYIVRFAEVDNVNFQHQGLDNVSILSSTGLIEQCDDGNNVNGDGCIATCQLEGAAIGTLLGSTGNAGLALIDIDPATGAGTLRAPAGSQGQVTDMVFREDGTLFGVTGGGSSNIIEIDPASGVETLRCVHTFGAINGIEFIGGTLYGAYIAAQGNPSDLVIIGAPDPFGECPLTVVGPTGFGNVGGLAYEDSTGILYGCTAGGTAGGDLVTCNPATGLCTLVGPTGFDQCSALEFGLDGTLYGGVGGSSADAGKLISIDPATGAGTEVGPTGFPVVSGLAVVDGEPNDDFAGAVPISCPSAGFSLVIDPLDDVDYFRLTGPAGFLVSIDVDAAELGSTLDSALGTFDSSTAVILISDDDPAPGEPGTLDSYLEVFMPGGGEMFIAVASFSDFDFNGGGDGTSTGFYNLSVSCTPVVAVCGDSFITPPETCEPPGVPSGGPDECRSDCTFCGDGVINGFSSVELIANGDFETGTLAGWTLDTLAGSSGAFVVDAPGTALPLSLNPTAPNPGGGAFYAVSDIGGPATHALSQAFTVPAGATQVLVSFEMFVDDWNGLGAIVNPAGLDHTAIPNQHARVDIMSAGAAPFDTGAGVAASLYLDVDPAIPPPNPYLPYNIDITPFVTPGATFSLRFAITGSEFFLHQGLDNVSVIASGISTEQCDDGNNVDGDGCTATCILDSDNDGVPDDADNCPLSSNPGQGAAFFDGTVMAIDDAFEGWNSPQDVDWVRGDIASLSTYGTLDFQSAASATTIPTPETPPPGSAFFWLVRPGCLLTSWSSGGAGECPPAGGGACPPGGRDGNLPP